GASIFFLLKTAQSGASIVRVKIDRRVFFIVCIIFLDASLASTVKPYWQSTLNMMGNSLL
ncbi:MAG: hypothetical protein ACK58N_20525, partial [Synechocystis sp.]